VYFPIKTANFKPGDHGSISLYERDLWEKGVCTVKYFDI
jgi:hypothetical protein